MGDKNSFLFMKNFAFIIITGVLLVLCLGVVSAVNNEIANGQQITLFSNLGKYLGVNNEGPCVSCGSNGVVANRDSIGNWEKFYIFYDSGTNDYGNQLKLQSNKILLEKSQNPGSAWGILGWKDNLFANNDWIYADSDGKNTKPLHLKITKINGVDTKVRCGDEVAFASTTDGYDYMRVNNGNSNGVMLNWIKDGTEHPYKFTIRNSDGSCNEEPSEHPIEPPPVTSTNEKIRALQTITIKDVFSHFLSSNSDGPLENNCEIDANRNSVGPWEKFKIVKLYGEGNEKRDDNSVLNSGDYIGITSLKTEYSCNNRLRYSESVGCSCEGLSYYKYILCLFECAFGKKEYIHSGSDGEIYKVKILKDKDSDNEIRCGDSVYFRVSSEDKYLNINRGEESKPLFRNGNNIEERDYIFSLFNENGECNIEGEGVETHLACVDNMCIEVPGRGNNECDVVGAALECGGITPPLEEKKVCCETTLVTDPPVVSYELVNSLSECALSEDWVGATKEIVEDELCDVVISGAICGNSEIEQGETCDGEKIPISKLCKDYDAVSYTSGEISCYAAGSEKECSFDLSKCVGGNSPTCGNLMIDKGEDCDSENLGGYNCTNFLPLLGNGLRCNPPGSENECKFDTSLCKECSTGETLCKDGSCKTSPDLCPVEGYNCNRNDRCDAGEGCQCEDCQGYRDGCIADNVCDYITKVCKKCSDYLTSDGLGTLTGLSNPLFSPLFDSCTFGENTVSISILKPERVAEVENWKKFKVGDEIEFSQKSSSLRKDINISWNFGDGNVTEFTNCLTGNKCNTTHIYTKYGHYHITATAREKGGEKSASAYTDILVYSEGINPFAIISSPTPEQVFEGVGYAEFNAKLSRVDKCTITTCEVSECPIGVGELKCYTLPTPPKPGELGTPDYKFWFEWIFDASNSDVKIRKVLTGTWNENYSEVVEFNRSFVTEGEHTADLKVGYEAII